MIRALKFGTLVLGFVGMSWYFSYLRDSSSPVPVTAVQAESSVGTTTSGNCACGPGNINVFVDLAKTSIPSVVNIFTMTTMKSPWGGQGQGQGDDMFRKFWEHFFKGGPGGPGGPRNFDGDDEEEGPPMPTPPRGGKQPKKPPQSMSLGSGFIIDASGLVLTNNHVVAGADEIKIRFTEEGDEEPEKGEVVGRDEELDLALIKVKTKRTLKAINLGDSDALQVGEFVMAVGNPIGHGHTVSHGIISAKDRFSPDFVLMKYLQTDAPINPGNSGGPLINTKGEVIGINNAIDARAQGIGFAIPINAVKKVLPQLKTKGKVSRGYVGVSVQDLSPEIAEKLSVPKGTKAPYVAQVNPGEPAEKAGVEAYDVVLEVNGIRVKNTSELIAQITSVAVGQKVTLKILRGGSEKTIEITAGERPTDLKANSGRGAQPAPKQKKQKQEIDPGMTLEDLNSQGAQAFGFPVDTKGVVVTATAYDGPADQAGVLRGDIIVEVDRKAIKDVAGFFAHVKAKKSYLLRVKRLSERGAFNFVVVVLDLKAE